MILVILKSMSIIKAKDGINIRSLITVLIIPLMINFVACNSDHQFRKRGLVSSGMSDSAEGSGANEEYRSVDTMMVLPKNPGPGEAFRILATGGENIRKAKIHVIGPAGSFESGKSKTGEELPFWRIDDFRFRTSFFGSPAAAESPVWFAAP